MGKEFLDAFEIHKLADIKTAGIILNVDTQTYRLAHKKGTDKVAKL